MQAQAAANPLEPDLGPGIAMLRAGRFADAVAYGRGLLQTASGNPRLFAYLADACQAAGELPEALGWIDQAIAVDSGARHKIKKAWLLSASLRRDEIPELTGRILGQAVEDDRPGLVFWQVARLNYLHNRLADAIECYERALRHEDRPDWRYQLALARFYAGDPSGAESDLETLLAGSPQAGTAIYLRSVLRRQEPGRDHCEDIRARLARGFQKQENEAAALYALAKELEDLGRHAESFEALEAGARKKRDSIRYDVAGVTAGLREICEAMDAEAMAAAGAGHAEPGAIFIVGMPRTGTTLVQRMLMQSGRLADAGELLDFGFHLTGAVEQVRRREPSLSPTRAALRIDYEALGRRYMQGARQMAGGSETFIDKLPTNFMYCGMIHKALPEAKIIHLSRDPLDTCYAVFKTLFFSAYEFSYDQRELADYYLAYRDMMRHWHEVMPGAILDVEYEALVSNPERESQRIYEWCGLEWKPEAVAVPDDRMAFSTASAAQVREPVHARSVNSSRRHVERLGPLIERLELGGIPCRQTGTRSTDSGVAP